MSGRCTEFYVGRYFVCIGVWTQFVFGVSWGRDMLVFVFGPFELTIER